MSLNKRIMFVQLISQTVWTEVRKQEGLRKPIFVSDKGKTTCCLSPLYTKQLKKVKTIKVKTTDIFTTRH